MTLERAVLGFVLVTICFDFKAANSLQCLECQDMPSPEDCRIITKCSGDNICYTEQVVTTGGLVLYNSGCTSVSRCSSKRSLDRKKIIRKRQDTVSKTDIVTCINCCKDEFCNIEGCGHKATRPPQRPPLCFNCANQIDPDSCRDVTLCSPYHMCALYHTSTSVSDDWNSECVPNLQCMAMEKVSLENRDGPCYTCCQEDFCNNICSQNLKSSESHTTSSTLMIMSPSKPQSPVSTLHASTSATIMQSTSTSLAPASATTQITNFEKTSTMKPVVNTVSQTRSFTINDKSTHSTVKTASIGNIILNGTTVMESTSPSLLTTLVNVVEITGSTTIVSDTNKPTTRAFFTSNCKNRTLDLCFLIDTSRSIGQGGFEKELQFVSEIVHKISNETFIDAEFCVVAFSTKVHTYVKLQQYNTISAVLNAIQQIPFRTGHTNTHNALQHAKTEFHQHGRQDADQEIILVTDGVSDNSEKTVSSAQHLKGLGIHITVVGIGTETNRSELAQIVPDNNHLFEIPDLDHLHGASQHILQYLCHSMYGII